MGQAGYSGRDNLEVMREAKNYNEFLLRLILASASRGETMVDFGAGNGTYSLPIAAAGYNVVCVETDPLLSLELASKGMSVLNDLEQAADASIDYIYSLNVLEHIEDDDGIAALWHRKLRPAGRLMVYVPAFQILYSSMDRKVGHIRRYRKTELSEKLRSAGFEVTESQYADSIGFLATLLYKLLGREDGTLNIKMLKLYDHWIFPISRLFDRVAHNVGGKNVYVRALKRV
jgi:SAM-dependent methyltransferase